MASLTDYKRLQVVTPDPGGAGGLAINENFKKLADRFGRLTTTDPAAGDDKDHGFAQGSRWFNTSANAEWICVDDAAGAAVWKRARSFENTIVKKTASYTLSAAESVCLVDAAGGAATITLPTASAAKDRVYAVKKIDSSTNAVTVVAPTGVTIDGAATKTLPNQYNTIRVVCDGSNWYVI